MFITPRCVEVDATRVSRDFICQLKQTIFLLFGRSHQVTPFWDFRRFFFYPPTSPSATRPTFPFSVLRPSIFVKSRLPYLNSAKAVSGCNDSENGLRFSPALGASFLCLLRILIGSLRSKCQSNCFGFGFTTLNWKLLYLIVLINLCSLL